MYTEVEMAARRTQIYLDDELRERIDRARARDGGTMAEVVREALNVYLTRREREIRPLAEVADVWVGSWRDESPPAIVRSGLDERARRLGY